MAEGMGLTSNLLQIKLLFLNTLADVRQFHSRVTFCREDHCSTEKYRLSTIDVSIGCTCTIETPKSLN